MTDKDIKIAVLLACFNRKGQTIACLHSFYKQTNQLALSTSTDIYLVDDGTDGTFEAVKHEYPDVTLLRGDGNLYWNGGMRLAFETALKGDYDYYLWLNDDLTMYPDALDRMFGCPNISLNSIMVGSTCDPITKNRTYGGFNLGSRKWLPLAFRPVYPLESKLTSCDTMNGNCVLIPRSVVKILGNLSSKYTHSLGDFDYGLRARMNNIKCFVVSGYIGECKKNAILDCFNSDIAIFNRFKYLHSPKGLPPKEWVVFVKRHGSLPWPVYYIKLLVRTLFP
jgi:GT2 family glycosyltransferase